MDFFDSLVETIEKVGKKLAQSRMVLYTYRSDRGTHGKIQTMQ
jgi:hypothetical protein